MKKIFALVLILSLTGCAVCKSSDSPEVCRTKQRDHSQRHSDLTSDMPGTRGSNPGT